MPTLFDVYDFIANAQYCSRNRSRTSNGYLMLFRVRVRNVRRLFRCDQNKCLWINNHQKQNSLIDTNTDYIN